MLLIFGGAGVFHAVEQVEIFLRPAARSRKHVADHGVRGADSAGALRGVIHHAGIEGQQLVVAAAVERQILHLPLADQAGDIGVGDIFRGGYFLHLNGLLHLGDGESEIYGCMLSKD